MDARLGLLLIRNIILKTVKLHHCLLLMLGNPKRYKDILKDQQVKSYQSLYVHLLPLAPRPLKVVLLAIAAIGGVNDLAVLNAKSGGYYPMITFNL